MSASTMHRRLTVSADSVKTAVYATLALQGVHAGTDSSRIPGLELDAAMDVMLDRAAALLTIMTGCRISHDGTAANILTFSTDVEAVTAAMITEALAERLMDLIGAGGMTDSTEALLRLIAALDAADCPPARPPAQY